MTAQTYGYVDIHVHALPGIDDGPDTIEKAVALAQAAHESGTQVIVATPHLRSDFPDVRPEELVARCDELREALARNGVSVTIMAGGEVSLLWALESAAARLRLVTVGQLGRDLLVEVPPGELPPRFEDLLDKLAAGGLRITLAHPERNATLQRAPSRAAALVQHGFLLQVNAGSLLPARRASPLHSLATFLCERGLIHFLGSDGHGARGPRSVALLSHGVSAAADLVGRPRAVWMSTLAPGAMVTGASLPPPPPVETKRRYRIPWLYSNG